MYQKLFQITVVLFFAVVSIAMLAIAVLVILGSASSLELIAGTGGISASMGGMTIKQLGLMIVAASLIIAGLYIFVRRRRFHR